MRGLHSPLKQAAWDGNTTFFYIHHAVEGDLRLPRFPARKTFILGAVCSPSPEVFLRDSWATLLLEGQSQKGRKLQGKGH